MKNRIVGLASIGVLAATLTGTARAQSDRLHLGVRGSYHLDAEVAGIGAQFSAPLASRLEFYPSIDYFFVDQGSLLHINADLKYRIPERSIQWLYLGAGLNISRTGSGDNHHSRSALNTFVGAESRHGRVHPFGELRLVVNHGTTAQLAFGLNFTLDR